MSEPACKFVCKDNYPSYSDLRKMTLDELLDLKKEYEESMSAFDRAVLDEWIAFRG